MIIRRIVFGEPKPGESQFAAILKGLDESVSYCNRVGPLQHDRITDLPFPVPELSLNFQQPTPLSFVFSQPRRDDEWGIFACHHMELYMQASASLSNIIHRACARLCQTIYTTSEGWDEYQETDGVVWGFKFDGQRAFVVFRGSTTLWDWARDLTAFPPRDECVTVHSDFGPMWGGFLSGMEEAWKAIKPLLSGVNEVILTGHSLGASRADIAAGYALINL